ncbi:MAG TPA: class I SAM-dependent methyltransferase [Puia sp.]|jgi:SAM-dependent methyltransferase|nr:class I SAM-dependent methyltransferase [Puia sp.]
MFIQDIFITAISYCIKPRKRPFIRLSFSFRSQKGLEIGGPSSFFSLKGYFPIYLFAKKIDGVNYSSETIWEGKIKEGDNYKYHTKKGHQYIKEATDLTGVESNSFDFILSCHSLEHVANPLKALKEWRRVLKKDGHLILILPDKNFSFDINREYTSMQHLISDFENDTEENDSTHINEVINTLDDTRLPKKFSKDDNIKMIMNNYQSRSVHHHVFDWTLINKMLEWSGFSIKKQSAAGELNMFTLAQKKDLPV